MQKAAEISPSLSSFKNPTKRHCYREDSSMVWFDYLGKTKPVKKYRCISQDLYTMEEFKHGQQQNALTSDIDFDIDIEVQEQEFAKREKLRLKRELRTHNDQQSFSIKYQTRVGMSRETREYLGLEVEQLPPSAFAVNCLKVARNYMDPVYIDQQGATETALMDVHLAVKASNRAENVPFICLTSESYGTAILGYPLEVGEIRDGSETLLPSKESITSKLTGNEGSRFHQLVWRTSKRTPVCYVTNSPSSSFSKNVQAEQASKNVEDSIPANGVLIKEKSLMELLKKPNKFNRGNTATDQACVPVELVFSKILAAV